MRVTFSVFVPGTPIPQGSKSISRTGHMYEANKKLPAWRSKMRQVFTLKHKGEPMDGPLAVEYVFYMPCPKRPKFNVPAVKPDNDKLQRAVNDALQAAGVVSEDSRITDVRSRKLYAADNEPPGVLVTIQPLQAT